MSQPSVNVVSAAINTVADQLVIERDIAAADQDGLAIAMNEAQSMIASQLARMGMSLKEATDLADEGAAQFGRQTPESDELASRAIRHKHDPIPDQADAVATAPEPVAPAIQHDTIEDVQSDAGDQTAPEVQAPAQAAPAPQAHASAPAPTSAPAVNGRAFRTEDLIPQRKFIGYKVEMKHVHEVFTGIGRHDELFKFKVPVLIWDEDHPAIPEIDPAYNMDLVHLLLMLYSVSKRRTTNLVGPHGCGKTEFVAQVAARLRFPLTVLPMDGQLTRSQLIGKEALVATPHGNITYFRDGLLPRAMREPGFILFDEIDRGVSDLQYACHSVYLNKGLTILEDDGRYVPSHDLNRVFATANTKGRGSLDGMYQASEEMSEATRDRLSVWIEMDYQSEEDDAVVLTRKASGLRDDDAKIIAGMAAKIREAFKGSTMAQTCSMRQQLEVAELYNFMSANEQDDERRAKMLRVAIESVISGRASDEDKGAIETLLQTLLPAAYAGNPLI